MLIQEYVLTSPNCNAQMPMGAKVLSVQRVDKAIHIWAEIDETKPLVPVAFLTFPTGVKLPVLLAPKTFIGTVLMGEVAWHIFMMKEQNG